ncbi:jg11579 [Pararge aegeria aegeria]|uniref:Jg11579 protein n=1 Tax=Pararge aegeria aegeria TaxID=348720 RepID=A0A8S4RS30_9NEOP|nr:jg11579 [Pararge aegeria aegeria]
MQRKPQKKIDVYGPSTASVTVAQIWFKRLQSGNFDVKDAPGRPITDKMDAIFEKVEQDRHIRSYNVAEELGIDHKTNLAHMKKTGCTKSWIFGYLTSSLKET